MLIDARKGRTMKLGLGTVQFGLEYGISNQNSICDDAELLQILELAQKSKIKILDTASSYGNAEERIGKSMKMPPFKIVTKVNADLQTEYNPKTTIQAIQLSLKNLNLESLYGCLCHHPRTMTSDAGKQLRSHLSALKNYGFFEKIGVSIYDLQDVDHIIESGGIDLVQVPLNLFDQRFFQSSALHKLKDKNIEIHVRSVFLQGLLLMPEDLAIEKKPDAIDYIRRLNHFSKNINISKLSLALGFISNIAEVDHIIVGVTSRSQLNEVIEAYGCEIDPSALRELSVTDDRVTDPRFWA